MLARFKSVFISGIFLVNSMAYADFLPPNNLDAEDGLRAANLTESDFNGVIDEVEKVYAPLIKAVHGATLKTNRLWSNSTVNASAVQFGKSWQVNMYGGLARRPEITRDGFALVMCHELGHHLGGYPFSSSWAANEGASDYFATLARAREIWKDQTELNASFQEVIPAGPKANCDKVWSEENDRNLCYRIMMGGRSTADLLATLGGTKIDWNTPDLSVVKTTYHAHPKGQCRLDTYMAGALCTKDFGTDIIPGKKLGSNRNSADAEIEAVVQSCTQHEEFAIGFRPLCWFKPALTGAG